MSGAANHVKPLSVNSAAAAPWLGNTLTHLYFDFERSLTNQYFTKPAGGLRGAALTLSYGQVNNDIGAPIYNLLSL